jgi:hypothetical protein
MADFTNENTIQSTLIVPYVFTPPSKPYQLPQNISPAVLLQLPTLQARFYADMIKDMGVPYAVGGGLTPPEMQQIILLAFGINIVSPNSYKTNELSGRYNQAIATTGITTYRNILKTSTLAISGYSNAIYQVYESGLGVDKVCSRITGCKSVDTAAAHLDTAGKGSAKVTSYLNMNIDSETLKSFGFPDGLSIQTNWTSATTCQIRIVGLNSGSPIDLVPNRGPALSPFTLGNAQKNLLLSELLSEHTNGRSYTYNGANGYTFPIPNQDIPSFMKMILLVKEYGDVLQILEYLAIITYLESLIDAADLEKPQKKQKIRSMFNMQTTDSVVFELCVALGLSCTYTGSREGVTSGGITVVIYESTPVAPGTNEKNRINSIYEGFKGQLNAVKFGVNTGIAVLSSLSYQIPDGWIAPGKRVSGRSASPRNTGDRTVTDIANNFYSDTQILYEKRMMNSAESTFLKMGALNILSDAIQSTLVTLANTYNMIIGGASPLGPLDQIDITAAESALQTSAIINFTIGTTPISAPYNEPPLAKVKGQGWVIQNDGMRAKFAEYSGYRDRTSMPLPHPVVQGGKKGVRKPVQSKKKPVHSKKKPVQYGGAGDSVELGLEECIYLKAAIELTRNDADADDMITLNYNEIVSQSISNPALYQQLLHQFGGYRDFDDAGNPLSVSMDEETSDTILREMNLFAKKNLHIADTDHIAEMYKLLQDYLISLNGILAARPTTSGHRKGAGEIGIFNPGTEGMEKSVVGDSDDLKASETMLGAIVSCPKTGQVVYRKELNRSGKEVSYCISIFDLLQSTHIYLSTELSKLHIQPGTPVFVTLDGTNWHISQVETIYVNGNISVTDSPGQFFDSSQIKITTAIGEPTTNIYVGSPVFVTQDDPADPASIWLRCTISDKLTHDTYSIIDSNGNPHTNVPITHIKLSVVDSIIDSVKYFWKQERDDSYYRVDNPDAMIALNTMFKWWTGGEFSGGNKKTKKRRNKRKHTKKMKFRKAPKSKKHRKTKRKGK